MKAKPYSKPEDAKYNHFYLQNENGEVVLALLGVDKEIKDEGEIQLLIDAPIIIYPDEFWDRYFKLNTDNRNKIREIMEKYGKKEQNEQQFCSSYWEVVSDYIFSKSGNSVYNIASEIFDELEEEFEQNDRTRYFDQKAVYDRIARARNVSTKPSKDTLDLIKVACAYYLITDDILRTGKGTMYTLKTGEYEENQELQKQIMDNYTIKNIYKVWKNDKNKNLKEVIMELTGLRENQLSEIKLQVAHRKEKVNKKTLEYLYIAMETFEN